MLARWYCRYGKVFWKCVSVRKAGATKRNLRKYKVVWPPLAAIKQTTQAGRTQLNQPTTLRRINLTIRRTSPTFFLGGGANKTARLVAGCRSLCAPSSSCPVPPSLSMNVAQPLSRARTKEYFSNRIKIFLFSWPSPAARASLTP